MKSNMKALINYYARIVQKGQWSIDNVPENLRSYVNDAIKELEPLEQPVADSTKDDTKK